MESFLLPFSVSVWFSERVGLTFSCFFEATDTSCIDAFLFYDWNAANDEGGFPLMGALTKRLSSPILLYASEYTRYEDHKIRRS